MHMSPKNVVIQLAKRKPVAFHGARDVTLECTEEKVWLTVEGQPGDFQLDKGGGDCASKVTGSP